MAQPRGNPDVDFNKTQNTITLTWFVIKGATTYQVDYRKQGETGDWTRVTGYFDRLPSAARGHRPCAVATGLDCNANYDFRVRARNQSDPLLQSLNGWTPYAYTQGRTGPCAQNGQITNVLATLTPQCAELSWTAPAGGHTDGYKIQRYIYDSSDTQETIRNNTGNVTNYSDCSQEYLDIEDGGRVVYYITVQDTDTFNHTSILDKGSFGYPNPPRNVRLTADNQFVRRLEWDPAPEAWRTTMLADREGQMRDTLLRNRGEVQVDVAMFRQLDTQLGLKRE